MKAVKQQIHARQITLGGPHIEIKSKSVGELDVLEHRINAYPRLVEALRVIVKSAMDEGGLQVYVNKRGADKASALLRELGEE